MTNDEIRARSRAAYREAFNGTGSEYDDFVNATARAIADAVTEALEEAAKVADERAEKRAKQVTVAGQAGEYAMESLAIARGSEAESIRDDIRALIPSTGTKE